MTSKRSRPRVKRRKPRPRLRLRLRLSTAIRRRSTVVPDRRLLVWVRALRRRRMRMRMRVRVRVLCVVPVRRAGRRHLDGERHRYTRVVGLVDAFAGWTWTRGVLEERRVRKTKPVRHSTEKQKEKEKITHVCRV